jgi:hypothetical protein
VTIIQASTFAIVFVVGVGVGLTAAFEEGLDDPQPLIMRPHIAITPSTPLAELTRAGVEKTTLGSLAR